MTENRFILGEWLKLALELDFRDNDLDSNNLVNFLITFIGQTQNSFDDYKHLLNNDEFVLDLKGNCVNLSQDTSKIIEELN